MVRWKRAGSGNKFGGTITFGGVGTERNLRFGGSMTQRSFSSVDAESCPVLSCPVLFKPSVSCSNKSTTTKRRLGMLWYLFSRALFVTRRDRIQQNIPLCLVLYYVPTLSNLSFLVISLKDLQYLDFTEA